MFNGNVERTQKTTEFYLYRAELLWERAAKENGVPPSMLSPLTL